MSIFFITGNKNKFLEAKSFVSGIEQLNIDLPEIQDIDPKNIIRAKILEALKYKKAQLIVEDTSLHLDCLNGLPGPFIKWFMATVGNDGLFNIAEKLGNKRAEAKTVLGYAKTPDEIYYFEGSIKGNIVSPRGRFGFGWDTIFQPDGYTKRLAELTQEEKNKISMRRIAFNKLKGFIEKID